MQQLINLYTETFNTAPDSIEKLSCAGSNRIYYRIKNSNKSVIGAIGTSVEENIAFITIARHFRAKNLRVPEIYAVSQDNLRYLQQDLGNRSLFDAIKSGRENGGNYSDYEKSLLRKVIVELPRLQILGAQGLDFSVCYPQPEFNDENVLFDLNYFKYCFLKPTGLDFNEVKLQKEFKLFAKNLTTSQHPEHTMPAPAFMYRDFQARNIMLDAEDNPWFIDFQGGRRGPVIYDLVSFLWQASAKYPQSLREELISLYFNNLANFNNLGNSQIGSNILDKFILFRLLQTLGAYGFRGYFERKQHFLDSMPLALGNLKMLIKAGCCNAFPYLKEVLTALVNSDVCFTRKESLPCSDTQSQNTSVPFSGKPCQCPLVIRITSFSYKKGLPQDPSGNGGGYVFDCRSTNNPGRYYEYKNLTGLDQPVIDFLEKDGEILRFLKSVDSLADFHVQRYIDRGFTHLMFSFGCTGGQHRSVYSAQHLAVHLQQKFGSQVKIELTHREQRPQAFILAAGLGTRLKPLTDTKPKALVRVGERTLLERTIDTLKTAGFQNIVINIHHFADQIKSFVKTYQENTPLSEFTSPSIFISDETQALLDTGGGLLKARHKFSQARPILIHNVDILSNADLKSLYNTHCERTQCATLQTTTNPTSLVATHPLQLVEANLLPARQQEEAPIATLLVSRRQTSRYLIFNTDNNLIGWKNINTGELKGPLSDKTYLKLHPRMLESDCGYYAFSGIHVVSPAIFPLLEEYAKSHGEKFSITDFYLWASKSHKIKAHIQEDLNLTDVGKIAVLEQLNKQ